MTGVTAEQTVLERTYAAFNVRDIDTVLIVLHPNVIWPKGMEGGTVVGHAAVRAYWTRQWTVIDPRVEPRGFTVEADGRVAVTVHQLVRDLGGTVLKEATVEHVYAFEDGLIKSMEIRA